MQLYAVRIFVRSWPESCVFYGQTLGLTERHRSDEFGWAEYDLGGPCFGVERVAGDDAEALQLVGRFVGVSLRVDDIEQTYARLLGQGVEFEGPPQRMQWGGSLAHFFDPDRNVLTLLG